MAEPEGHGFVGVHIGWYRGAVDLSDMGFILRAKGRPEHGHVAVIEVFDPFGGLVQPISCGDDEAGVSLVVGDTVYPAGAYLGRSLGCGMPR